jgi:hypothetical protein
MPEIILPLRETCYSEPVRSVLDLVESLLVEGLKHGHFNYSLTCELGTKGRRLLIVKQERVISSQSRTSMSRDD